MGLFEGLKKRIELRGKTEKQTGMVTADSELLSLILENPELSEKMIMRIPAVAASVNLITSLCASIQYKLYANEKGGGVTEVRDNRVRLFNRSSGDLLSGYAMKRAFVRDYLLNGNGYIYIDRLGNRVKGLYYVHSLNVGAVMNADVIFKDVLYNVQGKTYEAEDFIRIIRASEDGVHGRGLRAENSFSADLVNKLMKLLDSSLSSGGMKKGFLKAESRLRKEQVEELKSDYKRLYEDPQARFLFLNSGIDFQEASESAVELGLNDFYNSISADVGEVLGVPENIKNNTATEDEFRAFIKTCIMPIANEISAALNDSLLLEKEKGRFFWRADAEELENGDLKHQLEAYKTGIESNIIQVDEARAKIGLPPLGFGLMRLDLASVFIDPKKGLIYTPNTNSAYDINNPYMGISEEDRER